MRRKTAPKIDFDSHARSAIRRRLLNWYDKNKRNLPWRRRQQDPYAQWVAESMLQQTRVETVLRFYEPFLARFPTVEALAKASHQHALKMWEGLGYYRRILNLHRAAKMVCQSGSEIPTSSGGLRELPGVGTYTAAAIASIAYGEPAAAVDGNVARVIARLLGMTNPALTQSRARIQSEADMLLHRRRPGDFNQAWMDLGSSICLSGTPRCGDCPLNSYCATSNSKLEKTRASVRPRPLKCSFAVGILVHKDRMLVRKRPLGGLWSGLWEFPNFELGSGLVVDEDAERLTEICLGSARSKTQEVGVIEHQLTHRRMFFHVFEAAVGKVGMPKEASARWVDNKAFQRLPVSTAHRRIHRLWQIFRAGGGSNRA